MLRQKKRYFMSMFPGGSFVFLWLFCSSSIFNAFLLYQCSWWLLWNSIYLIFLECFFYRSHSSFKVLLCHSSQSVTIIVSFVIYICQFSANALCLQTFNLFSFSFLIIVHLQICYFVQSIVGLCWEPHTVLLYISPVSQVHVTLFGQIRIHFLNLSFVSVFFVKMLRLVQIGPWFKTFTFFKP